MVERYPVNDYAHFCLGRSLEKTGRSAEARRHAALAANMRPGPRRLPRLPRASARGVAALRSRPPLRAHRARVIAHGQRGLDTRPSSRSSARSSSPVAGTSAWTQMSLRARAAEPDDAGLAVPPEQHPGVEVAGAVQHHGLSAQQPVGQPQTHVEWLSAGVLAGHREPHSPAASRRGAQCGQRGEVAVDDLRSGHSIRVRVLASAGATCERGGREGRGPGGRQDRPRPARAPRRATGDEPRPRPTAWPASCWRCACSRTPRAG